ncbi:MAG TPA: hypothetical protein VGQ92_18380 [Actinoplanes sp.]|nr:hypothetical protein [Actinoplanes sp.]
MARPARGPRAHDGGLARILSVTGRLAATALQRRFGTAAVVAVVFAVQGVAAASLPLVGRDAVAAVIGVIGFGLGFGVATIARPVLLADRYDTRRYATIAGLLVLPMTLAKATAPLAAAALHARTGTYTPVFVLTGVACAVAAAALAAAGSRRSTGTL